MIIDQGLKSVIVFENCNIFAIVWQKATFVVVEISENCHTDTPFVTQLEGDFERKGMFPLLFQNYPLKSLYFNGFEG